MKKPSDFFRRSNSGDEGPLRRMLSRRTDAFDFDSLALASSPDDRSGQSEGETKTQRSIGFRRGSQPPYARHQASVGLSTLTSRAFLSQVFPPNAKRGARCSTGPLSLGCFPHVLDLVQVLVGVLVG